MIEKERLEELIEQGATIWTVNKSGNINPVKTNKTCEIQRQYLMKEGQIYSYIEQTFETEEEAKWAEEFGCIERTERLELPTWEEFQNKDCVGFITKTGKKVNILNYCFDNEIYISDTWYISETFEYTQDGYTLACRKAKELFLGENK